VASHHAEPARIFFRRVLELVDRCPRNIPVATFLVSQLALHRDGRRCSHRSHFLFGSCRGGFDADRDACFNHFLFTGLQAEGLTMALVAKLEVCNPVPSASQHCDVTTLAEMNIEIMYKPIDCLEQLMKQLMSLIVCLSCTQLEKEVN
jgi:hypothetical protein